MNFGVFILFSVFLACESAVPIVLWHGMGDSCCSSGSLGRIIKLIEEEVPGVEVLSLKFGNNTLEDVESGYFLNSNKQVEIACNEIASNPVFSEGYHAVGFSQGSQFLRAVAQRCPSPPMKVLVTLGGQHQGIYGLPHCGQPTPAWCDYIRKLLNEGAYTSWIQNYLVQAQYWHDPLDEEAYKNHSIFLADINNEKAEKNEDYSKNLQQLEKLVLVLFQNDTMVIPRESAWFGFYAPGQADKVLSFEETELFTQDFIGLRPLVASGKVDFISIEGDHLEFSEDWFKTDIIAKYLK